ncbi:hypothetical protein [Levilactobacillus phage ENFP1]|nr:hypothetical protein [Levilactobacillus phage ENFP1]
MIKVELNELTGVDIKNLMDNKKVWEKVTNSISEETSEILSDFINSLEGLGNYSINDSSDYNNCLYVANSYKFLGSLDYACGFNAGVLSDEQIHKANKLVSDYEESADDDQQEQLENDMDSLANEYAGILLDSMVAEYDAIYDNKFVEEYAPEILEGIYPKGAYYNSEDNSIYYMVKD